MSSKMDIANIIIDIENEEKNTIKKPRKRRSPNKSKTSINNLDEIIDEENINNIKNIDKRKKDYMRRRKSHLKKGAILPIYEDWKDQTGLMGYAKLVKRISVDSEEQPYERATVGSGKIKEPDMVIYKFQRWNIEFVDPLDYNPDISQKDRWRFLSQKGFKTNWNIAYFETVDANFVS